MKNKYLEQCLEIFQKGGTLWLIERTDTHEFLYRALKMYRSDRPRPINGHWSKDIGFFHVFFLTEQDAKNEIQFFTLKEGSCECCGQGGKKIPIAITEHEFTSLKK